jgi:hypothetical protein
MTPSKIVELEVVDILTQYRAPKKQSLISQKSKKTN